MFRRAVLPICLLSLLAACESNNTVLTVNVRTDLVAGQDFARVETLAGTSPIDSAVELLRAQRDGLDGLDLIVGVRVAELSLPDGPAYVRVSLLGGDGRLVQRRDLIVEVRGATAITVPITRRCSDVMCPGTDDPSSFTECVGGRCVDPRCSPETPEFCGEPECTGLSDCPSVGACGSGLCVEGACFVRADDERCAPGESCRGDGVCRATESDAGTPTMDAGMDGGVDAGPPPPPPPPPPEDAGPPDSGLVLGANYCPSDSLTRAAMAVLLVRYIHGGGFVPPPATGVFTDVNTSSFAAPFIEQLARDGITLGCAANLFCPSDAVTRGQAAVFFIRTRYGSGYTPPPATGIFTDVTSSTQAPFVERFYLDGITAGCAANRYCPNDPVRRDQVAVFLTRMRHGTSYTPPAPVGLFDDVPPSHARARYIEQIARDGLTNGCGR